MQKMIALTVRLKKNTHGFSLKKKVTTYKMEIENTGNDTI